MQDVFVAEGKPLSEAERVIDTFIAPSKTFTDILRKATWWLPFVIFVVFSAVSAFSIQKTVGFDAVTQRQIELNPKQQERMEQAPPEQRASQLRLQSTITKFVTYGFSVPILLAMLFFALIYWLTLNFGLGAATQYWQVFAVLMYASLPRLVVTVLNIIFLFAHVNTENYDIQHPVGVNLAYFMPDASPALRPLLTALDIFNIWSIILTIIGFAIIARKTKGQAAAVVIGWTVLFLLIGTGFAAAFS